MTTAPQSAHRSPSTSDAGDDVLVAAPDTQDAAVLTLCVRASSLLSSPIGRRFRIRGVDYEPPVERFLVGPPARPPVSVPADLPFDPAVCARARWVLQVVLEVLDGHRPLAQLRRIVDPSPLAYLRAVTGQLGAGRRPRSRLGTVRVCQPHDGAAEVAAVCRVGGRVRAVAMRLEAAGADQGWRCRVIRLI
jgi:rhodanese-related sulfurtransferase